MSTTRYQNLIATQSILNVDWFNIRKLLRKGVSHAFAFRHGILMIMISTHESCIIVGEASSSAKLLQMYFLGVIPRNRYLGNDSMSEWT